MERITVDAGDVRLAVLCLRRGGTDEPVCLALHGFLDHAGSFGPLAGALSRGTFWALDLPGHGESGNLGGRPWLFVDLVAAATRALWALDLPACCLVGHSLGAGLAAFAAALAPDRVQRLVLLDGLGPLVEPPDALPDRLLRAMAEEDRLRSRPRRVYATIDDARATFTAVRSELTEAAVDALLPRSLVRVAGGLAWAPDPLVRAPSRLRLSEEHVRAFLRRVAAPVLVVEPEGGVLRRHAEVAAQRRALLAQVSTVTVPGGHHAHLTHPEPVARAIEAFWAGPP